MSTCTDSYTVVTGKKKYGESSAVLHHYLPGRLLLSNPRWPEAITISGLYCECTNTTTATSCSVTSVLLLLLFLLFLNGPATASYFVIVKLADDILLKTPCNDLLHKMSYLIFLVIYYQSFQHHTTTFK